MVSYLSVIISQYIHAAAHGSVFFVVVVVVFCFFVLCLSVFHCLDGPVSLHFSVDGYFG